MNNTTSISLNLTNNSTPPVIIYQYVYAQALTIWFVITTLLGIIGTIFTVLLFLTVVCRRRMTRTDAGNIMIAHLVAIEISMTAIHLPIGNFNVYLYPVYHMTQRACSGIFFTFSTCTYAGYWASAFLSINRMVALIWPHAYKVWTQPWVTALMVALPWAIAGALNLPFVVGHGGFYTTTPPWYNCALRPASPQVLTPTLAVYLPLSIVGVCYVTIFVQAMWDKLRHHKVHSAAGNALVNQRQKERRLRVAIGLFLSAFWYCACFFPNTVLISLYLKVYLNNPVLQLWMRTLFWCGYAINPIIFLAICKEYRMSLMKLLGQWRRCLPVNEDEPTSGIRDLSMSTRKSKLMSIGNSREQETKTQLQVE